MDTYGQNELGQFNHAVRIGRAGGRAVMEKYAKNRDGKYIQADKIYNTHPLQTSQWDPSPC